MKVCARCVLPETFPGVSFDAEGLCNHCRNSASKNMEPSLKRKEEEERFVSLMDGLKGRGEYDCLVALSGGKDSTYAMMAMKRRYGLRLLAVTFDNGFISERALSNMRTTTDALGVDHIIFKPRMSLLKDIFLKAADEDIFSKKALERASTICTSCIGIVKALALKTAIEKGIMAIGFGWSPGQNTLKSSVMRTTPALMRTAQALLVEPLARIAGDEVRKYFLNDGHFSLPERFPYYVYPFSFLDYDEKGIVREIGEIGWVAPDDTDSNSTNCLLNAYANESHIRRLKFHPYVWEIANMVRDGSMTREEGFEKIYGERPASLVEEALEKLRAIPS